MKTKQVCFHLLILMAFLALSCNERGHSGPKSGHHKPVCKPPNEPPGGSLFIPVDTANLMITSYLNSIDYLNNDTDLRSVIFDADSIRAYLLDPRVKQVKLIFAHKLSYISSGGQDLKAGYSSNALSFILVGYDEFGNYVYTPQNTVLDHDRPCPTDCPQTGTASLDQLPLITHPHPPK